jgi:urease accessory protein
LTPGNAGHAAWIYTSSFGGGLVDGDALALDLTVCAGATSFVSTQAATKVYRSPRGTRSDVRATVNAGGCLVCAPDPVICFAASRYRQTQRFDVAADASLVLLDWLSSGRHATGERWAFHEYQSRIDVHQGDRHVLHESVLLRAEDGDVERRLGRFDVVGLTLLCGPAVRDASAAIIARLAREPVTRRGDRLVVASAVHNGCLVRFAARSFEDAAHAVRECLQSVPSLLADNPWSRKW